jgi:hypothetical protein
LSDLEQLRQPPVQARTLVQQAAAGALVRLLSQLKAAVVLSRTPGIGAAEIDLVARSILESAITINWIGTDEIRAARFRNHGIVEAEKHLAEMASKLGFNMQGHPAVQRFRELRITAPGAEVSLPSVEAQAREADAASGSTFFSEGYQVAYRRQRSAMHGDSRVLLLCLEPQGASWMEMATFEVAAATGTLLLGAARALDRPLFRMPRGGFSRPLRRAIRFRFRLDPLRFTKRALPRRPEWR